MNTPEINVQRIMEAVVTDLLNENEIEFYSDDTCRRVESLAERLEALPCIDKKFGYQYVCDIWTAVNMASDESFYSGLQLGLSMIKNLIQNEPPVFHVVPKEAAKRTPRYAPTIASDSTEAFKKFMNDAADKLTEEELWRLIGRTEACIEQHREETVKLF